MILHQYDDQEPCQGMNCGTTTAQHSKECIAEHTAACAGGFFGKWQSMDSAPKDGTAIWAFNGEQARMIWIEGKDYAMWTWDDMLLTDADPDCTQPTHWMPLPPPPSLNE